MKFSVNAASLAKQHATCIIVGVFEDGKHTPTVQTLDKASKGHLSKLMKRGLFTAKYGQVLALYHLPGTSFEHVLLVGAGKKAQLTGSKFRKLMIAAVKSLPATVKTATTYLTELPVSNYSTAWKVKQLVEATYDGLYRFEIFKSEKTPEPILSSLTIHVAHIRELAACETAILEGHAISTGVFLAKNLANLPSNICTPTFLAEQAHELAGEHKNISLKILTEKDMQKLGMGALLAVAQGSAEPAYLICLEYKGSAKKSAPVALVGKGITFDTGGNSIKPADSMVGMKYDMCGAATVLGDALTYCERYKPDVVIDIATLTGAVVVALGFHATGLLTNDDDLAKSLIKAGDESNDRAWQLPLWEDYQEQIKSPFADMANTGGKSAGTITAACFLSRFTKNFRWAHLDVAGTAAMMMGTQERMATGRPIPMLVQYLIDRVK